MFEMKMVWKGTLTIIVNITNYICNGIKIQPNLNALSQNNQELIDSKVLYTVNKLKSV